MSKQGDPNRLIDLVRQYFHQLKWKYKGLLVLVIPLVLLAGGTLAGILEYFLYLSAAVKGTIAVFLVVVSVGIPLYLQRTLDIPSFKQFYRQLARRHQMPELGDGLDLSIAPQSSRTNFHEAAIRQNLGRLDYGKTKAALTEYTSNHRITNYYKYSILASTIALFAFVGFTLYQPAAVNRLAHFWITYSPPNPYNYTVEPGQVTLEQGEAFTPRILFENKIPENLSLAFKTEIENHFRQRNAAEEKGEQVTFAPISFSTDGSYYFEMDDFRSEEFAITVQLRPRFEQLSIQIIPPAYTKLDTTRHTYPLATLNPYYGSEIVVSGVTNKPVTGVFLHQADEEDSLALSSNGEKKAFQHSWEISSSDTLSFSMYDSAGLSNNNRFQFTIEPVGDQVPSVDLLEPSEDLQMQAPESRQLRYEAADDFGLTKASLKFEIDRAFSSNPQTKSLALPVPPLNREQQFEWNLPDLDLQPRDVVTYWIEVRDNDAYNGSKVGRSLKRTITITSMTEYLNQLESKEQEVGESLDKISESFDQMEQEYEQFKKQLTQDSENKWNQKQKLQQVDQQRQEVEKQVNDLNDKFEELRKDIEKNQSLAPETAEAYKELQQLMKELNNPEFAKALEELQKAMSQVSQEDMRKALDNYEFNEEVYRERIERTKELFKSLKLNSELEKMASALQKLSSQEQEISKSENPSEDLKRQQAIGEDLENVQEQLENLEENAPQKEKRQMQSLQQNSEEQLDRIQKEVASNIEQLKQQEDQKSPEVQQQQQDIQQQLQQLSGQMRDAKQKLNQQQKKINGAALQYILYSLLNLSNSQEELTKETENLPSRSQAFVEKARQEKNILKQFSMLSDSLYRVSSEIPSFSNQINKRKQEVEEQLTQTVNVLSERNKANAISAQKQSLGGINEITSMIANLLEQLQNQQPGSGGGMTMEQLMEQMQQMSGQQQKLNQEIQNMINDIQGDRLSRDQMERLNQLSRQQNQIRRQMRELQQSGNLESGDRLLSELERMSEDMEDAINEMRGGQLDQQLVKRQQNILSRMLSAEEAVQKRGEEERREATTADNTPQSTPPDVTLEELQQKIRQTLNDPDRTRFSEDYQRLIEQYFEILKEYQIQLENQ